MTDKERYQYKPIFSRNMNQLSSQTEANLRRLENEIITDKINLSVVQQGL